MIDLCVRWRQLWHGAAAIRLPAWGDLDPKTRQICEQFTNYHMDKCVKDIVRDRRWVRGSLILLNTVVLNVWSSNPRIFQGQTIWGFSTLVRGKTKNCNSLCGIRCEVETWMPLGSCIDQASTIHPIRIDTGGGGMSAEKLDAKLLVTFSVAYTIWIYLSLYAWP